MDPTVWPDVARRLRLALGTRCMRHATLRSSEARLLIDMSKILLLFGFLAPLFADTAVGASPRALAGDRGSASPVAPGVGSEPRIELGLGGYVKVGHPCPIRWEIPAAMRSEIASVEMETVDGDGVTVVYTQEGARRGDAPAPDGAIIRIGRAGWTGTVRFLDGDGRPIASAQVDADAVHWLPADQRLVAAIGDAMGLEELVRSNTSAGTTTFTAVTLDRAQQLPTSWRGYAPCDCLVLSVRNSDLLRDITPDQWRAMDDYIRRGGSCIVSMGELVEAWGADSQFDVLSALVPGQPIAVGEIRAPGLLESLVATDQPLGEFPAVVLKNPRGKIEMTLVDHLSRPVPWWIRFAHGHGTVQFVASDLGRGALAEWKDRKLLWKLLANSCLDLDANPGQTSSQAAGTSNYLGYSDLVGQLRASLDQFSGVRVVTFGQVTVVLLLVLIVVGPIDYYLSVRWLRRPDFSWYFSGFLLIGTSLGLTWLYRQIRPDELRINSVQILDVDGVTGRSDGRIWSHIYSGRAHLVDAVANHRSGTPVRLDWQGLPGTGLGGLDSNLTTEHGMPPYTIRLTGDRSRIERAGISAAGTKSLAGSWIGRIELAGRSQLQELAGVDQVSGTLVNPFDCDMRDAVLFYHNWFYRLNSRIPAGASIHIGLDNIPKDISRKLNDRRSFEQSELANRWDPADRNSIDRLIELMMFHKAASGANYTSLEHRYEMQLDFSNLLDTDRAIVIAQLDRPAVEIQVHSQDRPDLQAIQELNRVWCRLVIPVARPQSNSSRR